MSEFGIIVLILGALAIALGFVYLISRDSNSKDNKSNTENNSEEDDE